MLGACLARPGAPRRRDIFFYSILTNGAIYLLSLPFVATMALVFNAYYKTDWRAFQITAMLQLVFALTVPYLLFAGVSLGHAIGAPIIAAALLGFSALMILAFGLLVYPIVFYLTHRPPNWKRWLGRILGSYITVVALGFMAIHIDRVANRPAGQSVSDAVLPPDYNVVFYGQILEADGRPSGGAFVSLGGCEHYDRKMLQTGDDGIFQVKAQCAAALLISQVRNFSNARPCIRDDGAAQPGGPLARFTVEGTHLTDEDKPYWGGFSRENPYRITCSWSR